MVERRRASRREPIEVEVRGQTFVAKPLPWQVSADLGNEIVRQNVTSVNEAVAMYVEDNVPQLDLKLAQKISDWNELLRIAYPDNEPADFNGFDIDEVSVLILTSLEVNHLEHLNHLVDPNLSALTNPGGLDTSEGMEIQNGQKIESTLNFFSSVSEEKKSSTLQEASSSSS